MSWNLREESAGFDGIQTYDSVAGAPGAYNATMNWPASCNVINWYAYAAFRAASGERPAFVQGASNSYLSGAPFNPWTLAFPANTTAGNVIIVAVAFSGGGSETAGCTVTDSQGNVYWLVMGGHTTGAFRYMAIFATINNSPPGGANTVTVSGTTGTADFDSISLAIHEYSGLLLPQLVVSGVGTSSAGIFGGSINITIDNTYAPWMNGFQITWNSITYNITGGGVNGAGQQYVTVIQAWSGTPQTLPYTLSIPPSFGISTCPPITDGITYNSGAASNTFSDSLSTTQANDLLFLATATLPFCAFLSPGSPTGGNPLQPPFLTPNWLVINEPSIGLTDRTNYLYRGEKNDHGWTMELRQRGQATVPLWIPAGDTYAPTRGAPIYLFDQTLSGGYTLDFAGLIQDIQYKWSGTAGNRICTFTAISLESVFDTVYADGTDQFVDQTCGAILTALFNKYENGCPVSLGTTSAGATVPLFCPQKGQKLSELFNQLATTSEFTWGINPQTQQLYFAEPSVIPAPFTIGNANVLWDSFTWKVNGADYRNRQGIKLSDTAFPQSGEFFAGSGQQSFTLMRPVKQVVSAYVTIGSPNFATGTFSGQPSPGDTITIGPQNKPWSSGTYLLGTVIVSGGYVFQVTFAGTSGSSLPAFNTVTGATTTDGSVIWTCLGPYGVGAGEQASSTYTFVASLDNTQAFQILIGPTLAATVRNTVDAINSAAPYGGPPATNGKGVTFSLPTWEGAQVNATVVSGTEIKVTNKQAAIVGVSSLATTSTAFSWSSAQTEGGSFPQGSVGPNEPGTISIAVYPVGTSTAAPGLAYQEGSAEISLATPLNSGTNLNVWYTRADGGSIEVENTALVTALAAITHGTGKYQQFTDQSSQGLISTSALAGLQLAQQILEAYSATPTSFDFKTYSPGLFPGMSLVVSLTLPTGGTAILNGTWVIESVEAELIPAKPFFGKWGHYRYTIRCVDIQEIASFLDFWEGLASGSSGSSGLGGGGPLVATSGAAVPTSGNYGPEIEVNGTPASSQAVLNLIPGAHITINDGGSGGITIAGTTPLTTKGDLFVYGSSATRLGVGSNGQVLTANSSATDGVDWETIPTATSSTPGLVEPDGVTIDVSAGIISVPTATTSALGLVKPDGTTVDITSGTISVPTATTSSKGIVKPDGSTITISSGVISSVGGVTSLTTTGTSGAATLSGGTLNIPQYSGGGGGSYAGPATQNVVTSSRALNTVYHNTTGVPMWVSVRTNANSLNQCYINFVSDSSSTPTTTVNSFYIHGSSDTQGMSGTMIVLPGNYYKADVTAVTGQTLLLWVETY